MTRIKEALNTNGWKVIVPATLGIITIVVTLMLAFRSESRADDERLGDRIDHVQEVIGERLDSIEKSTTRTETIIQEAQRNGRL